MLKNGRNIRSNKVFTLTKTNDKRAFLAGSNNTVRIVLADYAESIRTFEHVKSFNYSLKDVAACLIFLVEKMNNNFSISLRFKYNTLSLQLSLKLSIVFDDTVMNDRNCAVHICVRMAVSVTRFTVSSPAGMADSNVALNKIISLKSQLIFVVSIFFALKSFRNHLAGNSFRKIFEHSLYFFYRNFFASINCNSRRIVSTIFQFFKRPDQNRSRIFISNVADNAAHKFLLYLILLSIIQKRQRFRNRQFDICFSHFFNFFRKKVS